jgi:hypothetical protein
MPKKRQIGRASYRRTRSRPADKHSFNTDPNPAICLLRHVICPPRIQRASTSSATARQLLIGS